MITKKDRPSSLAARCKVLFVQIDNRGKPVCIWKYKRWEKYFFKDILLIIINIGGKKDSFIFLIYNLSQLIWTILGTSLAFSTRPDRPVGTLDLTGEKLAENRPVQLQNITGKKPVRFI